MSNKIPSNLVELKCMAYDKTWLGEEPIMCCSGYMCGCMGLPIEPIICSEECYNKLGNQVSILTPLDYK